MRVLLFFFAALTATAVGRAQTPPVAQVPAAPAPQTSQAPATPAQAGQTVCGQPVPTPKGLPPAGGGPVVYQVVPCFEKQGGFPVVEANTYLYYIEMKSRLSNSQTGKWVPYDEGIEQVIREDFKRLWATNFLDDLAIRVEDYRFSNGVIGKMIVYDMEERQRVKIVDYEGLKKVDQSKIEEALKEKSITIRLDSFIDPGLIRRVTGVVRELYAAEGYQFAEIKPEIKSVEGGTKLVHVTFHVTEGPKVKIRRDRLCREPGAHRWEARSQDEGEQGKGFLWLHHRRRHIQGRQVRRGRAAHHRLLPRRGVHHGPGGPAADEDPRGLEGRKDPLDSVAGADHRREEVRGRRLQVRGKQGRQLRSAASALQDRGGRDLQSEEGQEGFGEGAGDLRLRRLLRVHRLSRPSASRPASCRRARCRRCRAARAGATLAGSRARSADRDGRKRRPAARRRDDACG